ncbi:MAG TPA: TolC family protein [Terracidiphilus sp.]|jgi:outer membrane protein TolC|nr:TolC family protein [Terracidiphilus sp.]
MSTARWLVLVIGVGSLAAAQEPLTLRQAIQQALGASPEAKIAGADMHEAKAGAFLARTQLLPQLSFTEDISRGDDPVYVFGSKLRQQGFTQTDFAVNALNRPQPIGNFSSRLSGSWLAFDSFRTQKAIQSADFMRKSAGSLAKAANQKIALDVVQAYQSVLYAERQIAIARHEEETAEALLSSVDDHVKAGLAVESDRMSAQVNVAARKQELIAAQGDKELAWAQLRVAMGAPNLQETTLQPIEPHDFPQAPLDQELQTAASTRSDLAALGQAQSAQAAAVSGAKSGFGPRVSAYGNWEQDRSTFAGAGGSNWVAGVQIAIDITPFGKRAQLAHDVAAKERVDAQLAGYQQQIRLQVTQAHIMRGTAQQSLETARAAVDQSAESLRILRNRYSAGLATITDLLRAEDAERQSQTSYWHAVYGNAMAYAQLLFATGTLTPDAAEELQ